MLKKYTTILIDLDDTLYDYHQAHTKALDAITQHAEKIFSFSPEKIINAYEQAKKQVKKVLLNTAASHNRLIYFQTMLELLALKPPLHALSFYNIYWDTFLKNMIVFEGVYDFLEETHKNKKICLVTNLTAHIQYRKIQHLGIADFIDHIVTSEEAGIEKPNAKIFNRALEKTQATPNQACMIGDDFQSDVMGASRLNMPVFWINHKAKKYNASHKNIVELKNFKELHGYTQ